MKLSFDLANNIAATYDIDGITVNVDVVDGRVTIETEINDTFINEEDFQEYFKDIVKHENAEDFQAEDLEFDDDKDEASEINFELEVEDSDKEEVLTEQTDNAYRVAEAIGKIDKDGSVLRILTEIITKTKGEAMKGVEKMMAKVVEMVNKMEREVDEF